MKINDDLEIAQEQAEQQFGGRDNCIQGYVFGYCTDLAYPPSNGRDFADGFFEGRKAQREKACLK